MECEVHLRDEQDVERECVEVSNKMDLFNMYYACLEVDREKDRLMRDLIKVKQRDSCYYMQVSSIYYM